MNPITLSNNPPNYQQQQPQRSYTEAPNLNNDAFTGTGTHIHSLVDAPIIRDVWEDNFEQEFKLIMNLAEKYRVIAMDTEFPGIVYRLNENDLESISNYHEIEYRTIKMNVDKLKVIQVGISIADEDGFMPPGIGTWQFNFKFDLHNDLYLKESIEMLSEAGIKFEQHAAKGIDPQLFSEYLIASGLVLNEDIKWISFHGGFDFAYLVRMLCGTDLPDDDSGFSAFLNIYFPCFFDIKFMTKEIESLKSGSLSKIASELRVRRIGPQHQAGSDALLTLSTYFKLRTTYFKGVPDSKHSNVLYGIGPHGNEGLSDYVWQNFIVSEYPYMMYNSYNMGQMNQMTPMMNNNYYSQNDGMYGGMGGMSSMSSMSGMGGMGSNQYNMSYNNYGSYGGSSQYMEPPSNKPKKFGK